MKTRIKKSHFVIAVCLVLFSALYIWNIGVAGQKEVKLPKVVSKAKSIEVVNVQIEGQHTLIVTLRNNSETPVVAITLETGNAKDGSGITAAGYQENDEPDSIIIRPHDTYDMDMPLSYLHPDGGVRVSGVIYADETEEGERSSIEVMRKSKARFKSTQLKKGGGAPQ